MKVFFTKLAFSCALIPSLLIGMEGKSLFQSISADRGISELTTKGKDSVIVACKRIYIEGFPEAYNPTIIRLNEGLLLLFRSLPHPERMAFVSDLGAMWLNESLEPISSPRLILTRKPGDPTPQQSEDIRVFLWKGEPYIVYNDNIEVVNPSEWHHRDMFIAKLNYEGDRFYVDEPKKLVHCDTYETVKWQKNWMPFEYEGELLVSYTINPHEVLCPDFETGICYPLYTTKGDINWHWGKLRGGTLAEIVDGQYLSFFHSPLRFVSETTQGRDLMHYFIGAYTYSATPPFNVTSISPYPMVAEGFYTPSPLGIRCVYPGGFVTAGSYFYLVYGKDDREVWVAIIDKEKLYDSLVPVHEPEEDEEAQFTEGY